MTRWVEPFAAALGLRNAPGLVLLESMPGFGDLGRRSFLACDPDFVDMGGLHDLSDVGPGWRAGWLSYDLGREIEVRPATAVSTGGTALSRVRSTKAPYGARSTTSERATSSK